jgi:hypothetical protein
MRNEEPVYSIQNNLVLVGTAVIRFDYNISESVCIGNILVVLLEKPIHAILNENVFGINLTKKEVVWQIKKRRA